MDINDELEEYAGLESSELGEMLSALVRLSRCSGYSDRLKSALEVEMQEQLSWLKENCEIVEHERTFKKTVRELKFNDE